MAISASRIFHVNANCRDLDQSLGFYRDLLGFSASTHPMPDRAQPGHAFGLAEVLWDGWMLQGDLGYGGLSLDLLEWKVPTPGGTPPLSDDEPGFHHLTFTVPDLDLTVQAMRAAGIRIVEATSDGLIVLDPDGITVHVVAGSDRRISRVTINCRDLYRSVAYYRDVVGLTLGAGPATAGSRRAAVFSDPGSGFEVELVHFVEPPMPPVRARRANDVGLFRMAMSTNDCAGDETIVRAGGLGAVRADGPTERRRSPPLAARPVLARPRRRMLGTDRGTAAGLASSRLWAWSAPDRPINYPLQLVTWVTPEWWLWSSFDYGSEGDIDESYRCCDGVRGWGTGERVQGVW